MLLLGASARAFNAAHASTLCSLLSNEGPTVADLALYAYTHVADEGGFEIERFAAIGAWLGRIRALPGYVPITA